MKSNGIDVLVAGAGPVGLVTALSLQARGMKVRVVDAKPRGVTHSYALALHPASLDILDSLGVADEVVAQSLLVRTLAVYSGKRRIVSAPVAPDGARFPFLAVVGQDALEAILAHALGGSQAAVAWSHRVARLEIGAGGVNVDVDELEERTIGYAAARFDWLVKRTHRFEATHLVGADGHDSLVRRQLNIDFPEVRPAENFAVFEFHRDETMDGEVALVLDPSGLGVLWPLPGGRARWSFMVDPEKFPDALREKNHEPVQIMGGGAYPALEESFLKELLAERAPWFTAQCGRVYWRMLVRFERRLASSFGRDHVWLAGDAAHLTGPVGIQSMNVGIREAREVADAIATSMAHGNASGAMRAYEAKRQLEWRRLLGLDGRATVLDSAGPGIAEWKDVLPACLPASGEALVALARQIGLDLGA